MSTLLGVPEHTADEFLGMHREDASRWAGVIGWSLRDMSAAGWFTDDQRQDRVNVWFDEHDVIVRAEIH